MEEVFKKQAIKKLLLPEVLLVIKVFVRQTFKQKDYTVIYAVT